MPGQVPIDGQEVWCSAGCGRPSFRATWLSSTEKFVTSTGLAVPWFEVWRWRAL